MRLKSCSSRPLALSGIGHGRQAGIYLCSFADESRAASGLIWRGAGCRQQALKHPNRGRLGAEASARGAVVEWDAVPSGTLQSLVIPDCKALHMKPKPTPAFGIDPDRHCLLRQDELTAAIACTRSRAGPQLHGAFVRKPTIPETLLDELSDQRRVHARLGQRDHTIHGDLSIASKPDGRSRVFPPGSERP